MMMLSPFNIPHTDVETFSRPYIIPSRKVGLHGFHLFETLTTSFIYLIPEIPIAFEACTRSEENEY